MTICAEAFRKRLGVDSTGLWLLFAVYCPTVFLYTQVVSKMMAGPVLRSLADHHSIMCPTASGGDNQIYLMNLTPFDWPLG